MGVNEQNWSARLFHFPIRAHSWNRPRLTGEPQAIHVLHCLVSMIPPFFFSCLLSLSLLPFPQQRGRAVERDGRRRRPPLADHKTTLDLGPKAHDFDSEYFCESEVYNVMPLSMCVCVCSQNHFKLTFYCVAMSIRWLYAASRNVFKKFAIQNRSGNDSCPGENHDYFQTTESVKVFFCTASFV